MCKMKGVVQLIILGNHETWHFILILHFTFYLFRNLIVRYQCFKPRAGIQGIHKRMVRFVWFIQLIPHHSFVYVLYIDLGVWYTCLWIDVTLVRQIEHCDTRWRPHQLSFRAGFDVRWLSTAPRAISDKRALWCFVLLSGLWTGQ
jgi:hypothetical protein